MKRFFLAFAVLAALVASTFVACTKEVPAIDQLVTDAIISEAMNGLADDMANTSYSYTRSNGITWTACMKARHAVYRFKFGKDWFDELYNSIEAAQTNFSPNDYWVKRGGNKDTYVMYKWIMNTARQSLDTPEELKAAYARHKETTLKCVRDAGILQLHVSYHIATILPYFIGERPTARSTVEEVNAYQFAERRRAEGGDVLVAAYAEILRDFASSL